MKKTIVLFWAAFAVSVSAQRVDVPIETGMYGNDWESLSGWECPEWFKDAKFGIWAHWGPQCQAEDGDWYARFMYYEGSGQYNMPPSWLGQQQDLSPSRHSPLPKLHIAARWTRYPS